MALVKKIERSDRSSGKVHAETFCEATVFRASAGDLYLQLDTYGSATRKMPNKVSQSLQLNRDGARVLKALLESAFPGL